MLQDRPLMAAPLRTLLCLPALLPGRGNPVDVFFGSKGRGTVRHPDVKVPDMKPGGQNGLKMTPCYFPAHITGITSLKRSFR